MQDALKQFDGAMFEIYSRAKSEAGYNATIFLTNARQPRWIGHREISDQLPKAIRRLQQLYERGRLDLTVEAMITENSKWH
jgi:hypothetical protein